MTQALPATRFPSIEEWVRHPSALDRLLNNLSVVSTWYALGSSEQRLRMCGFSYRLFLANERIEAGRSYQVGARRRRIS